MRIIKHSAVDRFTVRDSEPVPAWGPRVITVTSGKGGVGKTNLTVNLAIALARMNQRVIIFDADLGLANVDVLLGLNPRYNLYDHLYKDVPIEDTLLDAPGDIRVISGGSGFLELASLSSRQRSSLLDSISKLNNLADFIFIDTGAGISKDVLAFCAAADEVLMVVTPEPTSLADAYGLIKVLDRFKLQREVHLAVNQSRGDGESADTMYRLKTLTGKYLSIKLNYLGDIKYDPAVIRAVKNQKPFLIHNPDCTAAVEVQQMAGVILNRQFLSGMESEHGLQGFISKLSRLFK